MGDIIFLNGGLELCGGCRIEQLPDEQRGLAKEIGREIIADPELAVQYRELLLNLSYHNAVTPEQAHAISHCIFRNLEVQCDNLWEQNTVQ